jgi:hypothetical protein
MSTLCAGPAAAKEREFYGTDQAKQRPNSEGTGTDRRRETPGSRKQCPDRLGFSASEANFPQGSAGSDNTMQRVLGILPKSAY